MTDLFRYKTLEDLADALVPLLSNRLEERSQSRKSANEPDDWPNEPEGQEETDPWADDPPARENRSQSRSAPRGGGSGRQSSGKSRSRQSRPPCESVSGFPSRGEHTDRFDRVWTFGEPDAPECHGGHVAAKVEGISQTGNDYVVWACPVGFGKSYKQKCDLWDYV